MYVEEKATDKGNVLAPQDHSRRQNNTPLKTQVLPGNRRSLLPERETRATVG